MVKNEKAKTKIVVIGGTGLIGSRLVAKLSAHDYEVVAAARNTGVNTLTGEGLAAALEGASVVVDVSNSPSSEDTAVMDFFKTSTSNLLNYEKTSGVTHHVALSIVGTERLLEGGYFRAKMAQERLIKGGPIPYSIVRATQFFEFAKGMADATTDGNTVHLSPVLIQPIAADDVVTAVSRVATGAPLNGTVEVAGPEQFRVDEIIQRSLRALGDPRTVVADKQTRYFGAELKERTLVAGDDAILGTTRFEDWVKSSNSTTAKGAA